MATLMVRDLGDDLVARLRQRAAAHGRSVEDEHREILRAALPPASTQAQRREIAARLADFRERTVNRGSASVVELLRESRRERLRQLTGDDGEGLL